jgi:dihydrofolate synthase/folylpolyglutamate synthase
MGVMADKDCEKMIEIISDISRKIFTVTPDNKRALPSNELTGLCRSYDIESEAFNDIKTGFLSAREEARKTQDVLLITGSLYMYKDIIQYL